MDRYPQRVARLLLVFTAGLLACREAKGEAGRGYKENTSGDEELAATVVVVVIVIGLPVASIVVVVIVVVCKGAA